MGRALLVTADLMTTSQALGAAGRAGVELETARPEDAAKAAQGGSPSVVAIELTGPIPDLPGLVTGLREAAPDALLVAFGPHVQEILLAAARDAGCDKVITNGQFHRGFDELLREHAL